MDGINIDAVHARFQAAADTCCADDADTAVLLQMLRERTDALQILSSLTNREQEVVRLSAKGFSMKEVGRLLSLSVKTVEAHATSGRKRLERTRLELVVLAAKAGWA